MAIDGEQIENVIHIEYHGALFLSNGTILLEMKRRIAIAAQKQNQLQHAWRGHDINMKMEMLETRVLSYLAYLSWKVF